MKIQFCPISVLNALCNQAVGEVSTMEITFNDFSRKKDPSSFHPALEAHPLPCCACMLLHHWKPTACGNTEPMKGLTFCSLVRKTCSVQITPVLQLPHMAELMRMER